ncbi:DUF397 domain-containing protein [Streptomyces flavofungini]|uniref:DUF397 domain-containing protein n=1 Tax=Streptomyces flavofungini TaxID=68200 RepID=A0ABS0XFW1_9ACTN|nr:DUF397 domain-containing protein [Streptomyces flavofungini]MBJ3812100.1 DUF397 domain-containing protein [Streptomyces flavofungini]GHC44246.1 hypothetical protein GCM10010349_06060 [Streptomyces flavofungini]
MTLPPTIRWRKSSYSNGMGGECVEVALLLGDIAVRDSKAVPGPWITVGTGAWESFVGAVRVESPARSATN